MIEDQVHHEVEILAQHADVRPAAQGGIHLPVVDHRKPVIRAVRKKREHVDRGDHAVQVFPEKETQGDERRFTLPGHHIAIGDKQAGRLIPERSLRGFFPDQVVVAAEDQGDPFQDPVHIPVRVKKFQAFAEDLLEGIDVSPHATRLHVSALRHRIFARACLSA